jgi:hypothetical protein
MFEDGIKGKDAGDQIRLMDLSELVVLSMKRDGKPVGGNGDLPAPGPTTNTDPLATGGGVGDPATEEPPSISG